MTQTDKEYAIQLAMEYGFTGSFDAKGDLTFDCEFVDAVLDAIAHEREACAKVCDDLQAPPHVADSDVSMWDVASMECADAIRARGIK